MTATRSSNGEPWISSVVGAGLAALKRRKISSRLARFIVQCPAASAARAAAADGMMEADEVADIVIEGLHQETFLILPHPEVETYMQRKTADYDRWLKGMNRLHRSLTEPS